MDVFQKKRIGRSNYFLFLIGLSIAWVCAEYYIFGRLNLMLNIGFRLNFTQLVVQPIWLTASQIMSDLLIAFLTVCRLHDANKSGWLLIGLLALGLAGSLHFIFGVCALIGFLVLLFLPGTIGPNRFGADPLGWESRDQFDKQEKMLAEEQNK